MTEEHKHNWIIINQYNHTAGKTVVYRCLDCSRQQEITFPPDYTQI